MSIEDNHTLINNALKAVCNRLNKLGIDYYLVGALSAFIGTNTPLFRYHDDIDFMVAEKDISKVKKALQETEYEFLDNRLNNKKILKEGVGHTQGEHEVIANHKYNEFHLGFFLFRRERDNSLTIREYFMQQDKKGKIVPMVLERHCPRELVNLEYNQEETEYSGTKFRTATPESVFTKKMYTKHQKDILDLEVLKDKIDYNKIEAMKNFQTTLRIVEAENRKEFEE